VGKTKDYHLKFWKYAFLGGRLISTPELSGITLLIFVSHRFACCKGEIRWHADDSSFWSSAESISSDTESFDTDDEDEGDSSGDY